MNDFASIKRENFSKTEQNGSRTHMNTIPMTKDIQPETVFFYNAESMFSLDGALEGRVAKAIAAISARSLWYGYDILVLPCYPDNDFYEYVQNFSKKNKVLVPTTIQNERLSISDILKDPQVAKIVENRIVVAYIGSSVLFEYVSSLNGYYLGGNPNPSTKQVNDKGLYKQLSKGIVSTPRGVVVEGFDQVIAAIFNILQLSKKIHLRKINAAGGHGNYLLDFTEFHTPSMAEVKKKLMEWDTDWQEPMLVEEWVKVTSSPAVTFEYGKGFIHDNLQITHKGKYWGMWSPLPSSHFDTERVATVGNLFAERMREVGYYVRANTDLGIAPEGDIVGFEINGRVTASKHSIAVGEIFLGPWSMWRKKEVAILSIDHFELRVPLSFKEIWSILSTERLLASIENPFGIVITIPPYKTSLGTAVGLQFHGHGSNNKAYLNADKLYQRAIKLIGDADKNTHDSSLISIIK